MKQLILTLTAAFVLCLAIATPQSASANQVCIPHPHAGFICRSFPAPEIPKANDPTGRLHNVNQQ